MILNFLKTGYDKISTALSKTRAVLGSKIRSLFKGSINADKLEQLEEILYEADLGVETASELTAKIKAAYAENPTLDSEAFIKLIREELLSILKKQPSTLVQTDIQPAVILVVGVNGSGKTTSVAKLANLLQKEGKKVLLGAADTFRAAAIEQLEMWAHRLHIDIVKGHARSDPAAVAFDTVTAGKARNADIVIVDTAGRLHTKAPLMQELEKVKRSCNKVVSGAPHETLLVLDATIGQNALEQVKIFHSFTPITGLILTKLDGTAKGGIAIAIQKKFGIPIKFIGMGEGRI
jgi:fused signal recognition particle receptor